MSAHVVRVIPRQRIKKSQRAAPAAPTSPVQYVHQEDRFSEEAIKKRETIEKLQNCSRIRITTAPYDSWGWGKVIIAIPGHVLIWFKDVHSHLCFMKET